MGIQTTPKEFQITCPRTLNQESLQIRIRVKAGSRCRKKEIFLYILIINLQNKKTSKELISHKFFNFIGWK
jgi:hypothetical protein